MGGKKQTKTSKQTKFAKWMTLVSGARSHKVKSNSLLFNTF